MPGQPMKRAHQVSLSLMKESEQQQDIFDRIEAGDSLHQIAYDLHVKRRFLLDWLEQPDQAQRYARSRVRSGLAHIEETIRIADDVVPTTGEVLKAKLRISTRTRAAMAFDPKTFGEGLQHQTTINLATVHADVIRRRSNEMPGANGHENPAQNPAPALAPAGDAIFTSTGTSNAATIDAVPVPDKPASSTVTNTEQTR